MVAVADQVSRIQMRFKDVSMERLELLRREMDRIGWMLVGYVQTEKLQGQVLHKRGGKRSSNLSSHITQRTFQISDQIKTTLGVFSGVPYARIHELGGVINVPAVTGKLMVFQSNELVGQDLFDAPKSGGGMIFTRRHRAFTVNMPERSYLRSSLRDKQQEIIARMADAIGGTVQ